MNKYMDITEPMKLRHYAIMATEARGEWMEFESGQMWPLFWLEEDDSFVPFPFATIFDQTMINDYASRLPENTKIIEAVELTSFVFTQDVLNASTTWVLNKNPHLGPMITEVPEEEVETCTFLRIV